MRTLSMIRTIAIGVMLLLMLWGASCLGAEDQITTGSTPPDPPTWPLKPREAITSFRAPSFDWATTSLNIRII
jgi:hypothetical protein